MQRGRGIEKKLPPASLEIITMEAEKKAKITFCQSCGKPLSHCEKKHGTNADGSYSADYCARCYANGRFNDDVTQDEMIDLALSRIIEDDPAADPNESRAFLIKIMPMLKRWA